MKISLKDIENTLEKIVIPLLKEISEKNNEASTKEIVEAAAVKVISEIKKCSCNREILEALGQTKDKGKAIILTDETEEEIRPSKPYQYSFPNHSVGNEELGTGKNPNSMTWPPGFKS